MFSFWFFIILYSREVVVLFPFVPVIPIIFFLFISSISSSCDVSLFSILVRSISRSAIPGALIIRSYCSRLSRYESPVIIFKFLSSFRYSLFFKMSFLSNMVSC